MSARKIDLTGQRFKRLLVLSSAGQGRTPTGKTFSRWNCLCDCGTKTVATTGHLQEGAVRSCGCLRTRRKL